jgi:hypothetical protein
MPGTLARLYERFDHDRVDRALAEFKERGAISVGHPQDRWYSPERELSTMGTAASSVGVLCFLVLMGALVLREPGQDDLPGIYILGMFSAAGLAGLLALFAAHFEQRRRGEHGLHYKVLAAPRWGDADPIYIGPERALVGMWLVLGYWNPFSKLVRIEFIERGEGLSYEFTLSDGSRAFLGPEDSLPAVYLMEANHLNPAHWGDEEEEQRESPSLPAPPGGTAEQPLRDADSPEALLKRAYDGAGLHRAGGYLEAMTAAGELARDLDRRLAQLVVWARVERSTWEEIGTALGITGEDAQRRFTPGLARHQDPALPGRDPEAR